MKGIGERVDSAGRRFIIEKLTKISGQGDSIWSSHFEIQDEAPNGLSLVRDGLLPDGLGGVFFVWAYRDSAGIHRTRAQRIDSSGAHWPNGGLNVIEATPIGFAARGKLGIYAETNAHAHEFDTSGTELWPQPFSVLSDPSNAYFEQLGSDHRGGGIIVFWTTLGGIFAQHTGRNGQVGIVTSVRECNLPPNSAHILQNFPNPFNPSTIIRYFVYSSAEVRLVVYDILGREVTTLVEGRKETGWHLEQWDAPALSSGAYYCRLVVGGKVIQTTKMLLLR